jgi:hypothetical protein
MRTTANIATVRGYEAYAGVRPVELAGAAKAVKNIALFAAAPFIGLAYAAAFPFVAVGMIAWYGVRALVNKARAG